MGVPSAWKMRRLVVGGQEAAGKILQSAARHDAEAEDDEAGQIAVFAAQAVTDPRAEAGPARVVDAGVQEEHAGAVHRQIGLHRADHGQVVGTTGDVRKQLAYRQPRLAVPPKRPRALEPAAIAHGGRIARIVERPCRRTRSASAWDRTNRRARRRHP